jgi:hypothetical protein
MYEKYFQITIGGILREANLRNYDLDHSLNLGISRIRCLEEHRDLSDRPNAKHHLEPIPGEPCASEAKMSADLLIISFEIALPAIRKFEVPLNKYIPFLAVWGLFEQDLEPVPGFRYRYVFAVKFFKVFRHTNLIVWLPYSTLSLAPCRHKTPQKNHDRK